MKNLFKTTAIVVAMTLSINVAHADEKIGFADPTYLLQNHPIMVELNAKVDSFMQKTREKFAPEENALSKEEENLVTEKNKIDEDADKLKKEQATVEKSLKKKVEALEKEAPRLRSKDIQARQKIINDESKKFQNKVNALQKREVEFSKKAEAFQKKVSDLQAKLAKEQDKANAMISKEDKQKAVDDINNTIKSIADSKGFTLVLLPSAALYAKNEGADITEQILTEIKEHSTKKAQDK
ncbi:OmpH family outer membrane protein [Otariodibacter sp.]|uniref:OmpH family outer membrane protein n=1 Tax=Otariodibacter sp. TaxID=3030919 RepID=UPI00262F17F2|nr:OmpH family outer membrane protein [Otariodibacter sp.]